MHWLLRRFPARSVWAIYVCINCFLTVALLSILAVLTGTPFVFPSVGPTAYLFFFSPLAPASRPRHAILGHAIGILCGYGSFLLASLAGPPQGIKTVDWPTVIAAALSLALTGAIMVLLRISHPPAGATTLIVSLGLLTKPFHLIILELAVVVLVVQALCINRLAGLPYPLWDQPEL